MNIAAKVAKSTTYQTLGKIVSVLLGLVQVVLLTNYFGAAGYGVYSAVTAFLGIAVVLSELGLHITNVTNISKPDADKSKILSNAFTMRVVAAVVVFSLMAFVGYLFLPVEGEIKIGILLATAAFALLAINQVFTGVFQKYFVNYMLVFGEIVAKIITIVAILILFQLGFGVLAVLASLNVAFGALLAVTMYFSYKYIPFSFAFDWPLWRQLLHESWPIAFSGILNLVYFRADTVILAVFKDPTAVGIYSVPYKILEVLIAFPALFAGLLLPILSSAFAQNRMDIFKKFIQNGFNALVYLALLVVAGTFVFSEDIVRLITRDNFEEFAQSVPVLELLVIGVAFLFLGNLFNHAVPALGLQKKMVKGFALGAVVGVVAYFTLIPLYSYFGAAIGTILTEAVITFYAMVLVLKKTHHKLALSGLLKAVVAAVIVYGVGWVLDDYLQAMHWVASAILVTALYFIILYKLRAVTKSDLKMIITREVG